MSQGELKIIWAKMLDKPNWFNRDLTLRIHNNLLDELLLDKRHHYILDVDIFDPALFTLENQLNADGKIRMWSEINEQIKPFDQYKVSLKPDDRNDRRFGREAGDFNRTKHRPTRPVLSSCDIPSRSKCTTKLPTIPCRSFQGE